MDRIQNVQGQRPAKLLACVSKVIPDQSRVRYVKKSLNVGHYSKTMGGHRTSYLSFAIKKLGGTPISEWELFTHKGPALFLMVEDDFTLYVSSSLVRSMLGRRTAGLLFRPGPAVNGSSLRLKIKRTTLRLLRHVANVQTLSIVPTPLAPKIGAIVDGWIHDFQLWDLSDADRRRIAAMRESGQSDDPAAGSLLELGRRHANGRPLLVALGIQNRSKGIELLVSSMRDGGTTGWAVLVAGRFDDASAPMRADIEAMGGLVLDRHLSDAEIEAAYSAATAVWCLYHPAYDQASGILGRAVQLGLPVVVRRDSFSELLCIQQLFPHVSANGGRDLAPALASLPPPEFGGAKVHSNMLETENIERLRSALGIPLQKST